MRGLLTLSLFVCAAPLTAQEPQTKIATVTLRAKADLLGNDVRLGDVAVVESSFTPLVERLHGLRVTGRPLAGRDRRIERLEIERLLASEGVPAEVLSWNGSTACRAFAKTTPLESDDVFAIASPVAESSMRAIGVHRFRLEPVGSKFAKAIAPGRVGRTMHARIVPGHAGSPYLNVEVDVMVDGELAESIRVQFEVHKQVDVLVPVRAIRRGEPLDGLVEIQTIEVRNGREAEWLNEQTVRGQVATRDLRPGRALQRADGRMPFVVSRNRPVEVRFKRGQITLTFMGHAMRDAGVGDQVRVRKSDGTFLETWVTGPGAVSMTPPEGER